MHERLRQRVLDWWARLMVRHRNWVLLACLSLAALCVIYAVLNLKFSPNRNDLISPDLQWNQRFIQWQEHFSGTTDLYLVIDNADQLGQVTDTSKDQARQLADDLGAALNQIDAIDKVTWRFRESQFHARTIRMLPMDQFKLQLRELGQSKLMLESPTPDQLISNIIAQFGGMPAAGGGDSPPMSFTTIARSLRDLDAMLKAMRDRVAMPADQAFDFGAAVDANMGRDPWQYLMTENERFTFVRITPHLDVDALSPFARAIEATEAVIEQYRDKTSLAMGLTGIDVIEGQETVIAERDSIRASLLATVLIAALMIAAFHSIRMPLLILISLGVGMAWSFGAATLLVGHLQVISVVFTVILLGLGVAFGIHLASRLELVRHNFPDGQRGLTEAMSDSVLKVGPGMITGGLTTSAAFATTMLTDFDGVAEMGLIAAVGVLLCLLSMLTVFPALVRLFKRKHRHIPKIAHRLLHVFEERWVGPFVSHPRITLLVAGIVMAASLAVAWTIRFDYDLMNLLPRDVPAVVWSQKVGVEGNQSVYSAVSIATSLPQARQRARRFAELDTVDLVAGVGLLFPSDEQRKLEMIEPIRAQVLGPAQAALDREPPAADPPSSLPTQIAQMRTLLALAAPALQQAPPEVAQAVTQVGQTLEAFGTTIADLSVRERSRRLGALTHEYQRWQRQVATRVIEAVDLSPMQLSDLPGDLLEPYVAEVDGQTRYMLEMFPRLPEGVTSPQDPAFLGEFIDTLTSIDDNITGVIVQIFYSGTLIRTAYLQAGVYAMMVVLVMVFFDFGSLYDALLSLVPVAVGFAVTFAVLELVGISVNPANIIVLPLMFGVGVDAGVHILHRYRDDPASSPQGLTLGTGKGVSLTSYTTMIGFGALMIAEHRGVASLGMTMTMGIGMTLLACWTIMPAWLSLRNKRHQRRALKNA